VHGVRLELEGCDDTEVSAATTECPEKILVFGTAGGKHLALARDNLTGQQIVDGHAVLANQPADTAAEREAADAGLRNYAAGDREAEDVRFAIQVAERGPALYTNGGIYRVNMDRPHSGKIDDEAVVTESPAANVVSAAADRGQQTFELPNRTASTTSATPEQRAMYRGRLSILAFQILRASS
jgi:hypothetical protein